MSDRISDNMVTNWLAWARNFEEIVAYKIGSGQRKRFRIRLPAGVTNNGNPFRPKQHMFDITAHEAADVVPAELMLTAREAMLFAMGCAVGRTAGIVGHEREWLPEWTDADKAQFKQRRVDARGANAADMDRERAEWEEARQQRIAAYKLRKEQEALDK